MWIKIANNKKIKYCQPKDWLLFCHLVIKNMIGHLLICLRSLTLIIAEIRLEKLMVPLKLESYWALKIWQDLKLFVYIKQQRLS